jgi:hypothetical protein
MKFLLDGSPQEGLAEICIIVKNMEWVIPVPSCNAPNFAVEFFLFFTRQNSGVTFSFSFSLR